MLSFSLEDDDDDDDDDARRVEERARLLCRKNKEKERKKREKEGETRFKNWPERPFLREKDSLLGGDFFFLFCPPFSFSCQNATNSSSSRKRVDSSSVVFCPFFPSSFHSFNLPCGRRDTKIDLYL